MAEIAPPLLCTSPLTTLSKEMLTPAVSPLLLHHPEVAPGPMPGEQASESQHALHREPKTPLGDAGIFDPPTWASARTL